MTRTFGRALCVSTMIAGSLGLGSAGASAQEAKDNEFTPLGIRAGAFLIHPELSVAGSYDDNILARENDEEDDFILDVAPTITAESQWSRHSLSFTLGGNTGLYASKSDNNFYDFGINAKGRVDVLRNSRLNIGVGLEREHQERDDQDDTGTDDITKLNRGTLDLNYRHTFNRVFVQPGVRFNRVDYEDANNVNNDDRDNLRSTFNLRTGYAVSPRFNVFAQGQYFVVKYDETPNDQGIDRNSEGYALGGGVEVELTGVLTGEVGAGYRKQTYDDNTLEDFSGFNADGALTWEVTRLTTIVGSINADLRETTVTVGADAASSIFGIATAIDVNHELRRNIILNGNVGYNRDDFQGTSRTDDTFLAGAGVRYLLNRNIGLDASYKFSNRSSDAAGSDFTRNIFLVGVVARL